MFIDKIDKCYLTTDGASKFTSLLRSESKPNRVLTKSFRHLDVSALDVSAQRRFSSKPLTPIDVSVSRRFGTKMVGWVAGLIGLVHDCHSDVSAVKILIPILMPKRAVTDKFWTWTCLIKFQTRTKNWIYCSNYRGCLLRLQILQFWHCSTFCQ